MHTGTRISTSKPSLSFDESLAGLAECLLEASITLELQGSNLRNKGETLLESKRYSEANLNYQQHLDPFPRITQLGPPFQDDERKRRRHLCGHWHGGTRERRKGEKDGKECLLGMVERLRGRGERSGWREGGRERETVKEKASERASEQGPR